MKAAFSERPQGAITFRRIGKVAIAPLLSFYAGTLGLLTLRGRVALDLLLRQYGLTHLASQPKRLLIPEIGLNEVLLPDVLSVAHAGGVSGNVSLPELLALASLVKRHAPHRLFEFGTFNGRTAVNLAINAPEGAEVFTLDLPADLCDSTRLPVEEHEKKWVRKSTPGSLIRVCSNKNHARIIQLSGDSATFDYSPYSNSCGFVFIDASHHYEYVMSDTERAFQLLAAAGGVICWHDYGEWTGVTRALEELYIGDRYRGIKGARHIEGTTLVFAEIRMPDSPDAALRRSS